MEDEAAGLPECVDALMEVVVQENNTIMEDSRGEWGANRALATSKQDLASEAHCSALVPYEPGAVVSLRSNSSAQLLDGLVSTVDRAVVSQAFHLMEFICYIGNEISCGDRSLHLLAHAAALAEHRSRLGTWMHPSDCNALPNASELGLVNAEESLPSCLESGGAASRLAEGWDILYGNRGAHNSQSHLLQGRVESDVAHSACQRGAALMSLVYPKTDAQAILSSPPSNRQLVSAGDASDVDMFPKIDGIGDDQMNLLPSSDLESHFAAYAQQTAQLRHSKPRPLQRENSIEELVTPGPRRAQMLAKRKLALQFREGLEEDAGWLPMDLTSGMQDPKAVSLSQKVEVTTVCVNSNNQKSAYSCSGGMAGKGAFGEAWRGIALDGHGTAVVMKRLYLQLSSAVHLQGQREVYFGELLRSSEASGSTPNLARYIAHFEDSCSSEHGTIGSFWVVYHDEGVSLYQSMFSVLDGPNPIMVPSPIYCSLRRTPGAVSTLLRGILTGLRTLHSLNITHRDVKMENVFVKPHIPAAGNSLQEGASPLPILLETARLGDFGSAVKKPLTPEMLRLFPEGGPNAGDETCRCQPPEALDQSAAQDFVRHPSFDVWGVGVLWLELLLGTTDVWNRLFNTAKASRLVKIRAQADPDRQCGERYTAVIQGLKLLGFLSFSDALHHHSHDTEIFPPTSHEATAFARIAFSALQAADTEMGLGLEGDMYALDLLRLLLHPDPILRITAEEALRHPYFRRSASSAEAEQRGIAINVPDPCNPQLEAPPLVPLLCARPRTPLACASVSVSQSQDQSPNLSHPPSPPELLMPSEPHSPVIAGVAKCQGVRTAMEDYSVVASLLEGQYLIAACLDGHNGNQVSEEISVLLPRVVESFLARGMAPENVLFRALLAIDQYVKGKPVGHAMTGSTAVVALISTWGGSDASAASSEPDTRNPVHRIWVANVGDCRAVVAVTQELDRWEPTLGNRVSWADGGSGIVKEVKQLASDASSSASRVLVEVENGGTAPLRRKWMPVARVTPCGSVRVSRLTQDHKPNLEGEISRISSIAAEKSVPLDKVLELPDDGQGIARVCGLAVSRSIGARFASPYVVPDPDVSEVQVMCRADEERYSCSRTESGRSGLARTEAPAVVGGDVWALLLCSDGIWDVLSDQEAAEIVMFPSVASAGKLSNDAFELAETKADLQVLAQLVVQCALSKGSRDNSTCVLLKIKWGEHRELMHGPCELRSP